MAAPSSANGYEDTAAAISSNTAGQYSLLSANHNAGNPQNQSGWGFPLSNERESNQQYQALTRRTRTSLGNPQLNNCNIPLSQPPGQNPNSQLTRCTPTTFSTYSTTAPPIRQISQHSLRPTLPPPSQAGPPASRTSQSTPQAYRSAASLANNIAPIVQNHFCASMAPLAMQVSRKRPRRVLDEQSDWPQDFFGDSDRHKIAALTSAMQNMDGAEDNIGMVDTWRKTMETKGEKIHRVCTDLLRMIKLADSQPGKPLGDRKVHNTYTAGNARFNALIDTLRSQKTVCKHLLEDPYAQQVVDDPVYASSRVQNNRRVNQAKKAALEEGRKLLGKKGNGKGRKLLDEGLLDDDDAGLSIEAHDNAGYNQDRSEAFTSVTSHGLRDRSRSKHAKYTEKAKEVPGSFGFDSSSHPAKKVKHNNAGTRQASEAMAFNHAAEGSPYGSTQATPTMNVGSATAHERSSPLDHAYFPNSGLDDGSCKDPAEHIDPALMEPAFNTFNDITDSNNPPIIHDLDDLDNDLSLFNTHPFDEFPFNQQNYSGLDFIQPELSNMKYPTDEDEAYGTDAGANVSLPKGGQNQ